MNRYIYISLSLAIHLDKSYIDIVGIWWIYIYICIYIYMCINMYMYKYVYVYMYYVYSTSLTWNIIVYIMQSNPRQLGIFLSPLLCSPRALAIDIRCAHLTQWHRHCGDILVGGGALPLRKMMEFVSWDDDIPNIWKHKKSSNPPISIQWWLEKGIGMKRWFEFE